MATPETCAPEEESWAEQPLPQDCGKVQVHEGEARSRKVEDVKDNDPQELGKEGEFVEQKMPESVKTAEEAEEDVEDDEPQELSGSLKVRVERIVDKDDDGAMACRESQDNPDQATD